MFIVVKYEYDVPQRKKTKKASREARFYVGQTIEVFANRIQVKFLRPHKCSSTSFTFPQVDDIDYIPMVNVVKILPQPTLPGRGIHVFSQAPI